jgi:hypothetical protein
MTDGFDELLDRAREEWGRGGDLRDFAELLHNYTEALEDIGYDREEAVTLTQGFQVAVLGR